MVKWRTLSRSDLLKLRPPPSQRAKFLKPRQRLGLVFEEHEPETTLLPGFPAEVESVVQVRNETEGERAALWRVKSLTSNPSVPTTRATIEPLQGGEPRTVACRDLVVVRRFGEPMYPSLVSLDEVRRGPAERPSHAVINGENLHALELLVYQFEGQVDCIYIDPPYNTGDRDWIYNNRYVDRKDAWRHSKWLSFMDKRLRLARRLLRRDGVLVVTIDENEVHHLGMLLEMLFPDALRQMVSICINPSGANNDGLARADEYAFFCFFGGSGPAKTSEDFLVPEDKKSAARWWESLLRSGSKWKRTERENLCYPIYIDAGGHIVGAGEPFSGTDETKRPRKVGGNEAAWPVRNDGTLGIWHVEKAKLLELSKLGYAFASSRDDKRGTWRLKYLPSGGTTAIASGKLKIRGRGPKGEALLDRKTGSATAKTMWHRGRHTAGGKYGTSLVSMLVGERNGFSYPKSLYAVRDALAVAVGDRKNALIVDFFAGSGTTLHASVLLNSEDGGSRRCILVTNNEVRVTTAAQLVKAGHFPGDPEFEAAGVFESSTMPRVIAAISGTRSDGKELEGEYLDGRDYADGFDENVELFRLGYLDPDDIDLRRAFDAILPILWLAAGGVGKKEAKTSAAAAVGYTIPSGSSYGVLLDERRFRQFQAALKMRADVTHVWLVTDSDDAFVEMKAKLPERLRVSVLPRDYIRHFRINTEPK